MTRGIHRFVHATSVLSTQRSHRGTRLDVTDRLTGRPWHLSCQLDRPCVEGLVLSNSLDFYGDKHVNRVDTFLVFSLGNYPVCSRHALQDIALRT
jgi:hypothetical protein